MRDEALPSHDRAIGAPVVLFGHGTMMDATMFAPQVAHLSGLGYHAVASDSRALTDMTPHSLADLAADIGALADDLGIGSFVPAGMSVGAFACIEFALAQPERCDGLILISGMAADYTPQERQLFGSRFDPLCTDGFLPPDFADWMTPVIFGRTARDTRSDLIDHWRQRWTTERLARAVWSQSTSWLGKVDHTSLLHRLGMPVLVIHGEEDEGIRFEKALDMVREIPDATLVKVAGAGHAVNLERPDEVNLAIAAFLSRIHRHHGERSRAREHA
jgi:pimeloyl-ACP methyl ester carboxylesterase